MVSLAVLKADITIAEDFFCRNPRGLRMLSAKKSYLSLVESQCGSFRPRARQSFLHTTSQSLTPPAVLLQQDDDEFDEQLDQEIEMFTSSCLSQLLPNEIFYKNEEEGNLAKEG
jgi:hypothetical protein